MHRRISQLGVEVHAYQDMMKLMRWPCDLKDGCYYYRRTIEKLRCCGQSRIRNEQIWQLRVVALKSLDRLVLGTWLWNRGRGISEWLWDIW